MPIPEPIKPKRAVQEESETMESRLFPAALHGAAFISSEGKAYRLFAEDECPSLGEVVQFGRFEYESSSEAEEAVPITIRFSPDSIDSVKEVIARADDFLEEVPSSLPLDEAIRRLRAVEGTWGRHQEAPAVRIFDSMSQSATHRAKQVLAKTQPMLPGLTVTEKRTEEKTERPMVRQSIRLFQTETVESDRRKGSQKPQGILGPFRHNVGVTEKSEKARGTNLNAEIQAETLDWAEIPLEVFDRPPTPLAAALPEPEQKTPLQPEAAEALSLVSSAESASFPLMHVVFRMPRRRSGFVPCLTPTQRAAERDSENLTETENPVAAMESVVETDIHEPSGPRCVSFRWPPVCEALKRKASGQIGSVADHLVALKGQGRKTICFHGFLPSEGCSTLLLCAVRELTDRGYGVLLVDANARNPELPKLLDVPTMENNERVMLGEHRLELLSVWDNTQDLPMGNDKNSHDFILIDAGSLTEGEPSEKTLFWQRAATDGVFLIVNTKNRQPVNLEAVGSRLHQHGTELLGVSENYV